MFEDFFTTYSMVEPPKIYKDNPDLAVREIEESNITKYPMVTMPTNLVEEFDEDYPGITSPYISSPYVVYEDIEKPKIQNTIEISRGPSSFEKILDEAEKLNPEVKQYRDFLVKTAKKESGFNYQVQNKAGAPYYGYFQMGKEEIKRTTGLSVEEFRNSPVQQVLGAVKLYKTNLKTIKALGIYNLGKQKGYSDDALVAGAWLGGPGGVKKFLQGKGDPSDSHWYGGKGGTSVGKRMNEFNK